MKQVSTAFLGAAAMATFATAGTALMDQIGDMDGSNIDTSNMLANQYFEAAYSVYNIGALDDYDNPGGTPGGSVEMVIGGWNGYASIDGISALQANFYSSPDAAALNLAGDVASADYAGAPTGDPAWSLAGYDLIGVAGGFTNQVGMNYVTLIPTNEFGTNGQTGCAIGFVGNLQCWQANPGNGFGFGGLQEAANNLAYRVMSGSSDPCDLPLPACSADITGPDGAPDGLVGVDDVLGCIGTFGQAGDGSSRPTGDCFPLPNGDCLVNVDDLLNIIGAFGEDCRPRGACCYGLAGCDEEILEDDCGVSGGDWLGEGSTCADCQAGACCFIDGSCTEGTPAECTVAGGTYAGDGIDCATANCPQPSPGACCLGPSDCIDGLYPTDCAEFAGIYMGSDTTCETISCGWEGCPVGSTDEGVACQEDTNNPNGDPNGGMNVDPPSYGAIANGETICGLMSTYTCIGCGDAGEDVTYRDTDWYLFDNSAGGEWTISGGGEMALVMGIVDNNALAFVDYFVVGPYEEDTTTVTLPAGGSYSVWVGFDFSAGENPCSTGANEYSVTLIGQDAPLAACCVLGDCIGDLDPTECASFGGTYVSGETCKSYTCPGGYEPCSTGYGEDPLLPEDTGWTAGTSDAGSGYARAMNVSAPSMSSVAVHGLSLVYNAGWTDCSADASNMVMGWTLYDDAAGLPGNELANGQGGTHAALDLVYASAYPLSRWDLPVNYDLSAPWIQINSSSSGQGECWFLWMSSTPADGGSSALNDGAGWVAETFNLNYCITP